VKRFEYRVVDLSYLKEEVMQKQLNEYGKDGWDLVSVFRREAVFKRPVESEMP
jgi:hypothetical protein